TARTATGTTAWGAGKRRVVSSGSTTPTRDDDGCHQPPAARGRGDARDAPGAAGHLANIRGTTTTATRAGGPPRARRRVAAGRATVEPRRAASVIPAAARRGAD